MISKNRLFICFSLFFLTGIFTTNIYYKHVLGGFPIPWWILGILFILFTSYYVYKKQYFSGLLIGIIGFFGGMIISYFSIESIQTKENLLKNYINNSRYQVRFEIRDTHKINNYHNEYIAKIISIENKSINKNILSIISIPSNFHPQKGYIIESTTKLHTLKNTPEFQYKNYMLSKNIFLQSYLNAYEIINIQKENIIEKYISKFRKKVLKTIKAIYPPEEGVFLGGILIGARESLPSQLKTYFNNSGLTHFIAVSGFNITILIVFLTYLLKYFPNPIKIIVITLAIGLFTLLVGETAPVVRASIMGLIGYYVLISGRQGNGVSIILMTAVIMVIMSPLSLNYDVSLHLSFLAVLGIMYTQNFFMKIFHFLPETLEIRTAFVLTLSALSFTLPIMVFNFGQVSIMAPLANIAVSWTIPIAMLLGFLSIIVFFVSPILGIIVGYLTWVFLKWDILMVHFFGKLDWSVLKIDLGIYKTHAQILYFAIIIFLIIWFRKKENTI